MEKYRNCPTAITDRVGACRAACMASPLPCWFADEDLTGGKAAALVPVPAYQVTSSTPRMPCNAIAVQRRMQCSRGKKGRKRRRDGPQALTLVNPKATTALLCSCVAVRLYCLPPPTPTPPNGTWAFSSEKCVPLSFFYKYYPIK